MGMTVKQVTQFFDSLTSPLFSIMFRANHAVGKSDVIRELAINRKLFLIDLRLGQRDLGDILGMPAVVDGDSDAKMTDYQKLLAKRFLHILPELMRPAFVSDLKELGVMGDANDTLKDAVTGVSMRSKSDLGQPYDGICMFFDEMNRGTKDVMQACFQIVLDREMNGRKLNPATWVFTAINADLDTYTVTEIDPALLSRFVVIDFEPTVEEWIAWGKKTGKLNETVIFTVQQNKELADPPTGKDSTQLTGAHPNRRSWTMFSKWLKENESKHPLNFQKIVCTCFVGEGAAEIWRIASEQMQQTKASRKGNADESDKKVEGFVKKFFRYNEMDETTAREELKGFNVAEMAQLSDAVVKHFSQFKYLSGNAKTTIKTFCNIVPAEYFAKVWGQMNKELKPRLIEDDPTTFGKFKGV
jgi:hypothetical protein